MQEIWKPIKNYEGLYEVSNLGRIKSLGKKLYNINKNAYNFYQYECIISPSTNKGYLQVNLSKNGISKCFKVHRLVAIAFIPNPKKYPQINHKNEIRNDNRVENLEWCDCKYNNNYGKRNIKISKKVAQYTKEGLFVNEFKSCLEVEKQLGFSNGHISKCCLGKRKSAYGYCWRYID